MITFASIAFGLLLGLLVAGAVAAALIDRGNMRKFDEEDED